VSGGVLFRFVICLVAGNNKVGFGSRLFVQCDNNVVTEKCTFTARIGNVFGQPSVRYFVLE